MKNYDLYDHTIVYTTKELFKFFVKEHSEREAFTYNNNKQYASVSFGQFYLDVETFGKYLFDAGFHNWHFMAFVVKQ